MPEMSTQEAAYVIMLMASRSRSDSGIDRAVQESYVQPPFSARARATAVHGRLGHLSLARSPGHEGRISVVRQPMT